MSMGLQSKNVTSMLLSGRPAYTTTRLSLSCICARAVLSQWVEKLASTWNSLSLCVLRALEGLLLDFSPKCLVYCLVMSCILLNVLSLQRSSVRGLVVSAFLNELSGVVADSQETPEL